MTGSRIELVAAVLHEMWRESRRQPDGSISPRITPLPNGTTIDIASIVFADLPAEWRAENLAAAEHAINWWGEHPNGTLDEAAEAVHDAWCARHGNADPNLLVPYRQLSQHERDKDLRIAELARDFRNNTTSP